MSRRPSAFLIVLLGMGGCATPRTADPAAWTRVAANAPWFMSGVTPTAETIRFALYDDVHNLDNESCPLVAHSCADENRASRDDFLQVERVRCRSTSEHEERCRFILVERLPQGGRVRLRCTGNFEIVGTSDYPSRWGVMEDEYERPLVTCRS